MDSNTNLLSFVKDLPADWVLAPILRKGIAGSPGKQPINESRERQLGPDDAALIIERNKNISAVGLWTGPKGNGVVIVDCDMNDSGLRDKVSRTQGRSTDHFASQARGQVPLPCAQVSLAGVRWFRSQPEAQRGLRGVVDEPGSDLW